MKKILLIVFILSILIVSITVLHYQKSTIVFTWPTHNTPTPTKHTYQLHQIPYQDTSYAYMYSIQGDENTIVLLPNFDDKLSARNIYDEHTCTTLINAGFYNTDHTPLGYFISNTYKHDTPSSSPLMNGYVWKSKTLYEISYTKPVYDDIIFALQNGPMLIYNKQVLNLSIVNDEPARRSVVFQTDNNTLGFITIFHADNTYMGPTLKSLPFILDQIAQQEDIAITHALNLDGGSAASYISTEYSLHELTLIGGAFCVY